MTLSVLVTWYDGNENHAALYHFENLDTGEILDDINNDEFPKFDREDFNMQLADDITGIYLSAGLNITSGMIKIDPLDDITEELANHHVKYDNTRQRE